MAFISGNKLSDPVSVLDMGSQRYRAFRRFQGFKTKMIRQASNYQSVIPPLTLYAGGAMRGLLFVRERELRFDGKIVDGGGGRWFLKGTGHCCDDF